MKKILNYIVILSIILQSYSCTQNDNQSLIDKYKKEITQTEKDFAEMALKEGIPKAFLHYAADSAVLLRNNTLVKGKKAIEEGLNHLSSKDSKLIWEPDFVDVAASGDLGYTYGHFKYSVVDSMGQEQTTTGIFHTVWKRQEDGTWRFVWD